MEAEKNLKRSVIKRQKRDARKEAARSGAVTARLWNVLTSPRKMRLVANLIRGERVSKALNTLKYEPKVGAAKLEKLLLSAISNWEMRNQEAKIEEADLYVREIWVDGGRMLKRLRPAPQGRAYRIRKRSNHVTLVLDSYNPVPQPEAPPVKEEPGEGKEEKKSKKQEKKPAARKKAQAKSRKSAKTTKRKPAKKK